MADIRKLSIASNPPDNKPRFKINMRVQVNNLTDGVPGPYHACQGIISALFKTDDGQPAARVMFSGGVEKKLLLTKLIPATLAPKPERPAPAPMTPAPALPSWANYNCIMVRGDMLQPLDIVYFSKIANPRQLQSWVNRVTWKGVTLVAMRGMEERFPGHFTIDPARWYVVERK